MVTLRIVAWHTDEAFPAPYEFFTRKMLLLRLRPASVQRGIELKRIVVRILKREQLDLQLRDLHAAQDVSFYLVQVGAKVQTIE